MAYHIADLKRLEIRSYSDQNPVLLGKCAQPTRGPCTTIYFTFRCRGGVNISCPSWFCSRCNVEGDAVSRQNQVNLANLANLANPFWKFDGKDRDRVSRSWCRSDKQRGDIIVFDSGRTKESIVQHSIAPNDVRSSIFSFQITWASMFSYFGRPCFTAF